MSRALRELSNREKDLKVKQKLLEDALKIAELSLDLKHNNWAGFYLAPFSRRKGLSCDIWHPLSPCRERVETVCRHFQLSDLFDILGIKVWKSTTF